VKNLGRRRAGELSGACQMSARMALAAHGRQRRAGGRSEWFVIGRFIGLRFRWGRHTRARFPPPWHCRGAWLCGKPALEIFADWQCVDLHNNTAALALEDGSGFDPGLVAFPCFVRPFSNGSIQYVGASHGLNGLGMNRIMGPSRMMWSNSPSFP
jgi:hypothetical protein